MDGDLKREGNYCRHHRILNLIPERNGFGAAEETALELRLGPPGGHWKEAKEQRERKHSVASVVSGGAMRGFFGAGDSKPQEKSRAGMEQSASSSGRSAEDHNRYQTRIAFTPLVGWPPVRYFRKYIPILQTRPLNHQGRAQKGKQRLNAAVRVPL